MGAGARIVAAFMLVATTWSTAVLAEAVEYRLTGHALVGKIWDVAAQRFVDRSTLAGELARADYVLLGETHDNPQHHVHQAWAVEQLISAGRRPPVAFEMITPPQLARLPPDQKLTVERLFDELDWDHSGWPDRAYYQPLFETVLAAELPLRDANLDRAQLRHVIQGGAAGLPPDIAELLQQVTLSEQDITGLHQEIAESHCGALPSQHVEGMSLGQRVRDAVMARAMVEARNQHGAILIAGNGHVRLDRGAPAYVRAADRKRSLRSVAWQEVREEMAAPNDYAAVWAAPGLPFDFVWFTARVERPDPCEAFREHMRLRTAPTSSNGKSP